jgi:hypothetical protein
MKHAVTMLAAAGVGRIDPPLEEREDDCSAEGIPAASGRHGYTVNCSIRKEGYEETRAPLEVRFPRFYIQT